MVKKKRKKKRTLPNHPDKNQFGNIVAIPGWDMAHKAFYRILPDFLQADIDSWHRYPRWKWIAIIWMLLLFRDTYLLVTTRLLVMVLGSLRYRSGEPTP
ncbi:hypothetical protein CEXT_247521 [Caerostris extrusa]|uniref:Uncharacterized protein n=1 Tax=Caerostris extrusa TaxID=172846 RepID=A0AAV4XXD4_CAEEX|nr:hypothetical protein CEXT_247521 [Caerostris extrusa]